MKTNILYLFFIALFFFILTCDKKPTEPEYDNPFDIENPQTGGAPFKLTAQIANGGITLEWNKPDFDDLQFYEIYRSEKETSGYSELGTAEANKTNYVDKAIENGHSYWYLITVVNMEGKETSRTNEASVNINTEPVLIINGGAQYTTSKEVSLTILAITAQQMMLANSNDFAGASWEAYATSKTWMLPAGDGIKTVFMKVKYESEESSTIFFEITLDTTPPIIVLTVTPDSGITDETNFQFDPTACSDNLAPAEDMQIRFDYENDGSFDTDWEQLTVNSYQFTVGGGDKTVKMQLKDGAGWEVETTANIFINTRPQSSFTATEDEANLKLWHFDASASLDYEDGENIEYRWDFNGDGAWDTVWLPKDTISYEYANDGDFDATLAVRDQNALTAEQVVQVSIFPSMTDIDGNVYKIVKIGDQWWMAENLKVTKYRNGDNIPNVIGNTAWTNLSTGAYCAYYNDDGNKATYGLLYNWYAVDDSRNMAPAGWHVPTDDEYTSLENYLIANGYNWDGTTTEDKIGKSLASKTGWYSSSEAGDVGNDMSTNNASGFTVLPGGYRYYYDGSFRSIVWRGHWWSSTESSSAYAWGRYLYYDNSGFTRYNFDKHSGFSVRLVRD